MWRDGGGDVPAASARRSSGCQCRSGELAPRSHSTAVAFFLPPPLLRLPPPPPRLPAAATATPARRSCRPAGAASHSVRPRCVLQGRQGGPASAGRGVGAAPTPLRRATAAPACCMAGGCRRDFQCATRQRHPCHLGAAPPLPPLCRRHQRAIQAQGAAYKLSLLAISTQYMSMACCSSAQAARQPSHASKRRCHPRRLQAPPRACSDAPGSRGFFQGSSSSASSSRGPWAPLPPRLFSPARPCDERRRSPCVARSSDQRRQRDPSSYASMDDLRAQLEREGRDGPVTGAAQSYCTWYCPVSR